MGCSLTLSLATRPHHTPLVSLCTADSNQHSCCWLQVKEAIDSNSLRRVAIKIINLRQLRKVREESMKSVKRELSIHRRLKHVNGVGITPPSPHALPSPPRIFTATHPS